MSASTTLLDVRGVAIEARFIAAPSANAPTLVFLHEGLGSVSQWRDFPDRLAREVALPALVYSRRGYGRSDPITPPRPLTYMHDEAREWLPATLAAAGITAPILVGHSDGASIAIIAAGLDVIPKLRALVLEAPHVFVEDVSVESIAKAKLAYASGDLRARLQKHHGDNVDGAFWGWNGAWLDPRFRAWNLEEFLPAIRVPTLVVQGTDDEYGTDAQVRAIVAQASTNVEVAAMEACGHAPHRARATETLGAIAGFLRARGLARR